MKNGLVHLRLLSAMSAVCSALWHALLLSGCESVNGVATKAADDFQNAMQNAHDTANGLQAKNTVRGRVRLKDGQTLTCFDGIQTGYLGSPEMSSPGEGSYDPKTGKATIKTAAIPAIIMTQNGTVISNDCDKLAVEGVLTGGGSTAAGPKSPGARPANSRALADTELVNLFEKYPQPGGGKTVSWPRVVITMLEAPSWGTDKKTQLNNFRPPAFGCWKFRARIFESEKVWREIPSFHRCTDDALRIPSGDNHVYYEVWSGLLSPLERRGSTGTVRTDGPNYPDNPLPVSQRSHQAKLNPVTFTGETIEGILYATGIDMQKPDPRLWFNFAPQMEVK